MIKLFKQVLLWEFTWSILITLLVVWMFTGRLGISIGITFVAAVIKAIGLTIFLKR